MRNAGVELKGDISKTAVVGPFEMLSSLGSLYGVFRRLSEQVEAEPPTAAILIDFPDFNLRLAKRIKHAGAPVIYYISPQVWAWRRTREADPPARQQNAGDSFHSRKVIPEGGRGRGIRRTSFD